jgi:hypothetical protein
MQLFKQNLLHDSNLAAIAACMMYRMHSSWPLGTTTPTTAVQQQTLPCMTYSLLRTQQLPQGLMVSTAAPVWLFTRHLLWLEWIKRCFLAPAAAAVLQSCFL